MEWKQAKFTNMYVPFSFKHLLTSIAVYSIGTVLALTGRPAMALDCPSYKYKPSSQTPIVKDMVNPSPSENDFELPMPCGGNNSNSDVRIAGARRKALWRQNMSQN
jgi:hypothetical protein